MGSKKYYKMEVLRMKKKVMRILVLVGVLLVVMIGAFVFFGHKKNIGPCTEYKCDVKNLHVGTTIDIYKEDEKIGKVKGNAFKFMTDPLTMYDVNENKLACAGDAYHFIAQDSHSIYVNEELKVEMAGLLDFLGESYNIYDANGKKVAHVTFNLFNTNGEMYNRDGDLIADYNSKMFFKDFEVRILENSQLDENTILMIFVSYYSDQSADSNKKSGS